MVSSEESRPPLPSGIRAFLFMLFSFCGLTIHVFFIDIPTDFWRWLTQRKKNIRDQVVVITGAGSGLGRRMAEILSIEEGANLIALDINEAALLETMEIIGKQMGSIKHYVVDICNEDEMKKIGEEIRAEYGKVDIVIANAGILSFGYFMEMSIENVRKTFDVNVVGTINTIRAFLEAMEAQNSGHIVTIASMAGFVGETFGLSYCKFAVRCVMEVLEVELRDMGLDGIRVTTLCPSFTSTPMANHLVPQSLWVPTMNIDFCARNMVDAILKEKILACFPKQCFLLSIERALGSQNVLASIRKMLDIRYEPSIPSETRHRLPSYQDFYLMPQLWSSVTTALFLVLNFIALLSPNAFNYLPQIGGTTAEFCKKYNFIFIMTTVLITIIHFVEALIAMRICDVHRVSFACSFKWFLQTFILGIPSLIKLRKYQRPKRLENV